MLSLFYIAALAATAAVVSSRAIAPRQWDSWGGPEYNASYGPALAPPFLNDLAKSKGKLWFGTAADIPGPEQQNHEYMTILNDTNIFGQLTPANYMKFEYTEPEQNVFNYAGGDVILDIAEAHGKYVRCHNLVWVSQLPDWVTNGNWTNGTLIPVMENHIKTLITHWGDRCYSWEVVNEALASNGSFSASIWYDIIGPEYFFLAYQFATEAVKAAGLKTKLYYNDYGIENPGNKTTVTAALVSELQARGIQIDGVGLESHFEVDATPSQAQQIEAMETFTALGVDVARTEIDVRFLSLPPNATVDACIGMTVWDFDDQYSWIPQTFAGEGDADLYWANFTRKPAYKACAEAILGQACAGCLSSY